MPSLRQNGRGRNHGGMRIIAAATLTRQTKKMGRAEALPFRDDPKTVSFSYGM